MDNRFDDIRPYLNCEINAAMRRICADSNFTQLAEFVFPEQHVHEIRKMLESIESIDEFQHKVMSKVNERIIKTTVSNFTATGIANLSPDTSYLYVSNHRDIMLDSSLLQYVLHINGLPTSEITFGANLMSSPLVVDVGKSNKMFRVERGGSPKDFYKSSIYLSQYIKHTLFDKKESIWIAQRNGRTKNGLDYTEPGLIRMFCAAHDSDIISAILKMNIVPVSISYEWETCDIEKALETYLSSTCGYTKSPGEDLKSILKGILSYKGNVNLNVGLPISESDLMPLKSLSSKDIIQQTASIIDRKINEAYVLHPTNFLAYDILNSSRLFSNKYSEDTETKFHERLELLKSISTDSQADLQREFLNLYANPVVRRLSHAR